MITPGTEAWHRALLALTCLVANPGGLGGLVLRARAGPVRDTFLSRLSQLPLAIRRIHPGISDDQLFGGIDLAATLETGRVVNMDGLLATRSAFLLTMSERCAPGLAARLAQHLDRETGSCLLLLDEGAEPEEKTARVLQDRVAFHLDLGDVSLADLDTAPPVYNGPSHILEDAPVEILAGIGARFGITNVRVLVLAHHCTRAHARAQGRDVITYQDVAIGAQLVFPSRATQIPKSEDDDTTVPPSETPEPSTSDSQSDTGDSDPLDADMIIAAVKALLPPNLLSHTASAGAVTRGSGQQGAGIKQRGNRRGRPLPSPWQTLRKRARPDARCLIVHRDDIRIRRFEERSDRLLIFAVDASGSAAVNRLNEAKGAVELLLAEAYARRDHVALISFRGIRADLLLPPTRSLLQTKRRLAALPGGGGTPMAAGLQEAESLARRSRSRGMSPTVIVLTDGRANIALDGRTNRGQAREDSEIMARRLRATGIPGMMIDVSNRPQPALRSLAEALGAPYLPLPRANAQQMSSVVTDLLELG
ncbi:MAG: magnesium chelatase subunit D [Rhodobacteraceae bacterium]|nr:magnesium chelatase subunit D [Paracoccaceae bacterium]